MLRLNMILKFQQIPNNFFSQYLTSMKTNMFVCEATFSSDEKAECHILLE